MVCPRPEVGRAVDGNASAFNLSLRLVLSKPPEKAIFKENATSMCIDEFAVRVSPAPAGDYVHCRDGRGA